MKNFFRLEPEAAGTLGPATKIRHLPNGKPIVHALEYSFDYWLGDDILESTPCFVVTEKLAQQLADSNFTGFFVKELVISKSDKFEAHHPDGMDLPKLKWLDITGVATTTEEKKRLLSSTDDLNLSEDQRLIVNEVALNFLRQFNIKNCKVYKMKSI